MTTPERRSYFNWTLFNRLAKILVVLMILALAIQSIYAVWFSGLQNDRGADEVAESQGEVPATANDLGQIFADFTSGAWQFGESDWDFRIYSSSTPPSADVPTQFREADPAFDDQSIIARFQELGVQPVPLGDGLEKWESAGQGFQLTLFTRNQVVQLMRTQLPVEQGVSTIEATPRSSQAAQSKQFLLPLIPDAKQIAVRVGADGIATSAIVHLNAEKQIDIRDHWKENGWLVNPIFDLISADRIEKGVEPPANTKYRCTKDGTIVEATFLSEAGNLQATIVLTLIAQARQPR